MKFVDLFSEGKNLPPIEQQNFRSEMFCGKFESIAENKMFLRNFRELSQCSGKKFMLGICPSWNFYDLYLLDWIIESLKSNPCNEIFEVFDLDLVQNFSEIFNLFGNPKVPDTPIFSIWKDGILQKSYWGWDAKTFLIERFNFEWQPPKS